MPKNPISAVDPDGLLEFSVVFTDRSLNHMSQRFIGSMQSLLTILRDTYSAEAVALVPGGGSYAMEAVARQLATGKKALVVRNGLFSFRWSAILEKGRIAEHVTVCQARPVDDSARAAWSPAPIDEVLAAIEAVLVAQRVPETRREAIMAAAADNLAKRLAAGEVHKVKVYDKAAPQQQPVVRPTPEQQRARERTAHVR